MRQRATKNGATLTFVGGGHETRQAIRRKMHEHLGTWDQFQAKTEADEDGSVVESAAVAA